MSDDKNREKSISVGVFGPSSDLDELSHEHIFGDFPGIDNYMSLNLYLDYFLYSSNKPKELELEKDVRKKLILGAIKSGDVKIVDTVKFYDMEYRGQSPSDFLICSVSLFSYFSNSNELTLDAVRYLRDCWKVIKKTLKESQPEPKTIAEYLGEYVRYLNEEQKVPSAASLEPLIDLILDTPKVGVWLTKKVVGYRIREFALSASNRSFLKLSKALELGRLFSFNISRDFVHKFIPKPKKDMPKFKSKMSDNLII